MGEGIASCCPHIILYIGLHRLAKQSPLLYYANFPLTYFIFVLVILLVADQRNMTRLVVLAFSMALISLVTSSAEEKEACSKSDIASLCKNYEICSKYGYITEEMRDGICVMILKDTTSAPELDDVETDPPKKTTTDPSVSPTSFVTVQETVGSFQPYFTEDTTTAQVTFIVSSALIRKLCFMG